MSESSDVERVKAILDLASSLTGDARRELLDRECGGDAALRGKVEHLLRMHDSASSFLEPAPAAGDLGAAQETEFDEIPTGRRAAGRPTTRPVVPDADDHADADESDQPAAGELGR